MTERANGGAELDVTACRVALAASLAQSGRCRRTPGAEGRPSTGMPPAGPQGPPRLTTRLRAPALPCRSAPGSPGAKADHVFVQRLELCGPTRRRDTSGPRARSRRRTSPPSSTRDRPASGRWPPAALRHRPGVPAVHTHPSLAHHHERAPSLLLVSERLSALSRSPRSGGEFTAGSGRFRPLPACGERRPAHSRRPPPGERC